MNVFGQDKDNLLKVKIYTWGKMILNGKQIVC